MKDYHAFTWKAPEIQRRIIVPVSVEESLALCRHIEKPCQSVKVNALWDTGASITAVSDRLAKMLDLTRIGFAEMGTARGNETTSTYFIDVKLRGIPPIADVSVVEFVGQGQFDIIIGMDIMSLGDFAVTTGAGRTVLSFRIPPNDVSIDYAEQ
jgi:hypothetical protein